MRQRVSVCTTCLSASCSFRMSSSDDAMNSVWSQIPWAARMDQGIAQMLSWIPNYVEFGLRMSDDMFVGLKDSRYRDVIVVAGVMLSVVFGLLLVFACIPVRRSKDASTASAREAASLRNQTYNNVRVLFLNAKNMEHWLIDSFRVFDSDVVVEMDALPFPATSYEQGCRPEHWQALHTQIERLTELNRELVSMISKTHVRTSVSQLAQKTLGVSLKRKFESTIRNRDMKIQKLEETCKMLRARLSSKPRPHRAETSATGNTNTDTVSGSQQQQFFSSSDTDGRKMSRSAILSKTPSSKPKQQNHPPPPSTSSSTSQPPSTATSAVAAVISPRARRPPLHVTKNSPPLRPSSARKKPNLSITAEHSGALGPPVLTPHGVGLDVPSQLTEASDFALDSPPITPTLSTDTRQVDEEKLHTMKREDYLLRDQLLSPPLPRFDEAALRERALARNQQQQQQQPNGATAPTQPVDQQSQPTTTTLSASKKLLVTASVMEFPKAFGAADARLLGRDDTGGDVLLIGRHTGRVDEKLIVSVSGEAEAKNHTLTVEVRSRVANDKKIHKLLARGTVKLASIQKLFPDEAYHGKGKQTEPLDCVLKLSHPNKSMRAKLGLAHASLKIRPRYS